MKIVVGLGNPGRRYRDTRHNLGFLVLDRLAAVLATDFDQEKHRGLLAKAALEGQRLLLIKPMTYMNCSGDCVAPVVRHKLHAPGDLLAVVDDVNLPFGRIRLRDGGSAGGHNGLKSLIERLGTKDFHRLRMGVGGATDGHDLSDHVLSRFRPEERPSRDEMVARAVDAVQCWARSGIARAMSEFNADIHGSPLGDSADANR